MTVIISIDRYNNITFKFIFSMQEYFTIGRKTRIQESMARTLGNRDR